MQPLSAWLDELLACEDDVLPDDLVDRIVARGEAARAKLLEVATSNEYRGLGAEGGGLAPFHALDVLAELPPDAATAARLVDSLVADVASDVAPDIAEILAGMGEVAAAPALAALAATDDPDVAGWLAWIVAEAAPRSDDVFAALVAAYERFPADVAAALSRYGDERALPALFRVLDAHVIRLGSTIDDEERCVATAKAIEALGGELNVDQAAKLSRSMLRQDKLLRKSLPRAEAAFARSQAALDALRAPTPNAPCPCGSGRKYKKCHEGDEDFLASLDDLPE